jgi:drug/metabolite transporter (DMT)-like permease
MAALRFNSTKSTAPARDRWRRWWPFVLLVLMAAARWLLAAARPEAESSLLSQLGGCAWAGLLCLCLFLGSRRTPAIVESKRTLASYPLAGALLLGGPFAALLLHAHQVDPVGLTMALALTPVAVAIAAAALGSARSDGVTGRIWPGIAAVTGLLLVLVPPNLSYVQDDLVFALAPICTGIGSALFSRTAPVNARQSRLHAALALAGAGLAFAVALLVAHASAERVHVSVVAIASDGILAMLSTFALLRLGATRWAAQFTLVPLLILVEGIFLVRPVVTSRWFIGLGLLVAASVFLLLPPTDEGDADHLVLPS